MPPREPAPGEGLRPTRAMAGAPPARRVGCWFVPLAVLLAAGACVQAVVIPGVPLLDREAATARLIAADVARADADARSAPRARRPVHLAGAAGSGEGVLEVIGERRVGLVSRPPRTWSRIARQWLAALAWSGGGWPILRFADPPLDRSWEA